jgi:hypothetical protein
MGGIVRVVDSKHMSAADNGLHVADVGAVQVFNNHITRSVFLSVAEIQFADG